MKNQVILFILSIDVSINIAATGCSGPLQSIESCHRKTALHHVSSDPVGNAG